MLDLLLDQVKTEVLAILYYWVLVALAVVILLRCFKFVVGYFIPVIRFFLPRKRRDVDEELAKALVSRAIERGRRDK